MRGKLGSGFLDWSDVCIHIFSLSSPLLLCYMYSGSECGASGMKPSLTRIQNVASKVPAMGYFHNHMHILIWYEHLIKVQLTNLFAAKQAIGILFCLSQGKVT